MKEWGADVGQMIRDWFNPFTLRTAKRGLTILEIFYLPKHFLEDI